MSITVTLFTGHRIIYVGNGNNLREKRNLFSLKVLGIPRPVKALMVGPDHGAGTLEEIHALDYALPYRGMILDNLELLGGELARLVEDFPVDKNLADTLHAGAQALATGQTMPAFQAPGAVPAQPAQPGAEGIQFNTQPGTPRYSGVATPLRVGTFEYGGVEYLVERVHRSDVTGWAEIIGVRYGMLCTQRQGHLGGINP